MTEYKTESFIEDKVSHDFGNRGWTGKWTDGKTDGHKDRRIPTEMDQWTDTVYTDKWMVNISKRYLCK